MARAEKTEASFMNFDPQTGCMIHQDSMQRTDPTDLPWVPMFKEYEKRHGRRLQFNQVVRFVACGPMASKCENSDKEDDKAPS